MARVYGYHPIPHDLDELPPEPGPRSIEAKDVRESGASRCRCTHCYADLGSRPADLAAWEPYTCCASIVCRQHERRERARLRAKARVLNTLDLSQYEPKRRTA